MSNLFTSQNGLGSSTSNPSRLPPSSSLSSLLVQANNLSQTGHSSDLPQIRYGLDEIQRMSKSMAGQGNRTRNQGEGHTLLSNLGINTSHLTHSIGQLPSTEGSTRSKRRRGAGGSRVSKLEEGSDIGQTYNEGDQDVGAWGRNWHETIILSGIEHQRQRTIKSFNDQFQARLLSNWESDKARILQDELGVTDDEIARIMNSGLGSSTLGKSTLRSSTRRFPTAQGGLSHTAKEGEFVMHTKMVRYEKVVSELNTKRLRKEPFELCEAFEESANGDKHVSLPVAYRLLAHLVHEPSIAESHSEPVQERQFSKAYLGEQRDNRAVSLRGRLVAGGKRFLEKDFESHVDETIAKHPKEAALGGVPGIKNRIRAFVDVQLRLKEMKETYKPEIVDGVYLWAQVYYLLRTGYPDEALEFLQSHQNALPREDYSFPGAFKTYLSSPDRRLPRAVRDQLSNDWNGHVRNNNNVDQFKYALYKLIGRFDLNRKSAKVASTTEDWVWLNLSLVRETRDDGPQDAYDLERFGGLVLGYGSEKFDLNGTRPFAWFNLLLYTGQFEYALTYLYGKQQLRTDAVHLASALQYYGLLRVSHPEDPIWKEVSEDVSSFNYARAIKSYLAPFARLEPTTALQYAYLVALGSDAPEGVGETQKAYALDLVTDIVLSSKAWSKLLGIVRQNGTKEAGAIECFLPLLKLSSTENQLQEIVLKAANQSAADASLTDSIELYHLAGSPNKVIETVNRALGSTLALPSANQPINTGPGLGISGAFGGTTDLLGLARRVYFLYEKDFAKRSKVAKGAWETLGVLLQLKSALEQFANDRPDLALDTFRSTGLLPLDNDPAAISRSSSAFKSLLDQPTISSLDNIVVTTMKCLHLQSQRLKQSPYGDHGRMAQIQQFKSQAQNLVTFASGLRLRLGPDVYRQLSSMSAFF